MKKLFGLIICCFILCIFNSCEKETSPTILKLVLQKENITVKEIKILDSHDFTTYVNFYEKGIDITNQKYFTFTNCLDTTIRIEILTEDGGFFRSKQLKMKLNHTNHIDIINDSLKFGYKKYDNKMSYRI